MGVSVLTAARVRWPRISASIDLELSLLEPTTYYSLGLIIRFNYEDPHCSKCDLLRDQLKLCGWKLYHSTYYVLRLCVPILPLLIPRAIG